MEIVVTMVEMVDSIMEIMGITMEMATMDLIMEILDIIQVDRNGICIKSIYLLKYTYLLLQKK